MHLLLYTIGLLLTIDQEDKNTHHYKVYNVLISQSEDLKLSREHPPTDRENKQHRGPTRTQFTVKVP